MARSSLRNPKAGNSSNRTRATPRESSIRRAFVLPVLEHLESQLAPAIISNFQGFSYGLTYAPN